MSVNWSADLPFDLSAVRSSVPRRPGVYEIKQSKPYPRYFGTTNVLRIGKSESDLQAEILNHFVRHTAANRLARIRALTDVVVTVAYAELPVPEAAAAELQLLREFEDRHFDLPVLNAQRGYARDEDRHYRTAGHAV